MAIEPSPEVELVAGDERRIFALPSEPSLKDKLFRLLNSLTAKYVAVFTLLVAVPAIGISWYLLDSSYNDNKRALIRLAQAESEGACRRIDQRPRGPCSPAALDPCQVVPCRMCRRELVLLPLVTECDSPRLIAVRT